MHTHAAAAMSLAGLPSQAPARAAARLADAADRPAAGDVELSDDLLDHVVGGLVRPWPHEAPLHSPLL